MSHYVYKDDDYEDISLIFQQADDHFLECNEPQPQTDQSLGKEALLVGNTPHIGGGIAVCSGDDHPPPLPPKSQQYTYSGIPLQRESDIPPPLPPKQNTNLPPLSLREFSSTIAEENASIPPPRPPKPGHLSTAKAAVPVRRARRSPPPTPKSGSSVHGQKDMDVGSSTNGCPNCAQLQKKNDKLKGIIQKQFLLKKSNTCPHSVRHSDCQYRRPTM